MSGSNNNVIAGNGSDELKDEILTKLKEILEVYEERRKEREEENNAEKHKYLFGEIERKVEEVSKNMIEEVRSASTGEIITLILVVLVILFYMNRAIRFMFRLAVRKNYEYLEDDGQDRTESEERMRRFWTAFWKILERILERIWIPLWISGDNIRRDTLIECVDADLEEAGRRLNRTRIRSEGWTNQGFDNDENRIPDNRRVTHNSDTFLIRNHRQGDRRTILQIDEPRMTRQPEFRMKRRISPETDENNEEEQAERRRLMTTFVILNILIRIKHI